MLELALTTASSGISVCLTSAGRLEQDTDEFTGRHDMFQPNFLVDCGVSHVKTFYFLLESCEVQTKTLYVVRCIKLQSPQ